MRFIWLVSRTPRATYKLEALSPHEGVPGHHLQSALAQELGSSFDIRRFHNMVVGNGSLPLTVLEDMVVEWIAGEMRQVRWAPKCYR